MANREARRRKFSVPRPTDNPVTVDLEYDVNIGTASKPKWETREASFKCVRRAPGGAIVDYLGAAMGGEIRVTTVTAFFDAVLEPSELERWNALLRDPLVAIPIEMLAQIANWLVGEYTARPTRPPAT